MDVTGKVISILPEESGNGKNGIWRKQSFVIETDGKYPKKICITSWGDKIDEFAVKQGETITAHLEIESREYNGRWYTDVKAWRVDKGNAPTQNPGATAAANPVPNPNLVDEDSLPF
jgi:hypothetical protein